MVELQTQMPLAIKRPVFDVPSALKDAAAIHGAELQNQGTSLLNTGRAQSNALGAMQLEETQGEMSALGNYRKQAAAGDPNAPQALAGYPELQLKMRTALDGMKKADQDEMIAEAQMMAHAAQSWASLPVGSPERQQAHDDQIDGLLQNGVIDDATHDKLYGQPPSKDMTNQLLLLGLTTQQYMEDRRAKDKEAEAQRPKTYDELPLADKLKIDQEARLAVEAAIPKGATRPVPAAEMRARIKAARNDILQQYGLAPDDSEPIIGGNAPIGSAGGPPAAATPPAAASPGATTRAVNPDTGEIVEWNGSAWAPVK